MPASLCLVVCVLCLVLQGLQNNVRERIQLRPQAMLEARDLPTNNLSNLLEQKVQAALAADRQARAAVQVGVLCWGMGAGHGMGWYWLLVVKLMMPAAVACR